MAIAVASGVAPERGLFTAIVGGLLVSALGGSRCQIGFWIGLIGPRQTLYKSFTAKGGQKRSTVHRRFNALRRFRNRVAHHEPIFLRPLVQLHSEIDWALHHSRFEQVSTTAA